MSLAVRSSPSPKISFAKDMDRTSNPPTEPLQTLQDQPTGSAQISGHHTPNTSRPESRSSPFSSALDAPTQLNIKFLEANSDQRDVTDLHDASASGNAPESPLSTIAVIVPQKRPLEDEDCDDHTPSPKGPITKGRAKSTKAPAPQTPSSRPTRNRKAPERLIETGQSKPAITTPARKTPTSRVFSPTYITTVSSSRLGKADVYHMLLEPLAWTSLTAEQQTTLISMLPKNSANQALIEKIKAGETEDTRPSAFTMSTDCFRTDVAKFKADLKNGHLAKGWRTTAEQAVIDRAEGAFDEWKDEEAELWWGQKGN